MTRLGMALVILGMVALIAGSFGYDRQQTVLEVGGLKATATERSTIPFAAVLGLISMVGGIAVLVGAKRSGAQR